jgi:hypothetical protein
MSDRIRVFSGKGKPDGSTGRTVDRVDGLDKLGGVVYLPR